MENERISIAESSEWTSWIAAEREAAQPAGRVQEVERHYRPFWQIWFGRE